MPGPSGTAEGKCTYGKPELLPILNEKLRNAKKEQITIRIVAYAKRKIAI